MSPINGAKTKRGYDDLKAVTGTTPPAELNQLSAADLTDLTARVQRALDGHAAAIADAEEKLVNMAPRPLRGTVRKILGTNS
ncbi:MAG: hypothetical protein ACRDKI_00985 [Solirubrobacterales bacterium]